jgi:hypothetical protein
MSSRPEPEPGGLTALKGFAQALAGLRVALTSGELAELNRANEALQRSTLLVHACLPALSRHKSASPQHLGLSDIQREIRIAGELMLRSSAANRRALAVFSRDAVSYDSTGLLSPSTRSSGQPESD